MTQPSHTANSMNNRLQIVHITKNNILEAKCLETKEQDFHWNTRIDGQPFKKAKLVFYTSLLYENNMHFRMWTWNRPCIYHEEEI